jgi:hypothetical protein
MDLPPDSDFTSQISATGFDPESLFDPGGPLDPGGPFDRGLGERQVLRPPDYDFESQFAGPRMRAQTANPVVSVPQAARYTPEASAQRSVGSPFRSAMERVEPAASPQVAPKSLFSAPGAQAAPARLREAGETPSP